MTTTKVSIALFAKQSLKMLKSLLDFDTSVFCMNTLQLRFIRLIAFFNNQEFSPFCL